MQGNGNSGDLNEIRLVLAEIAAGQARHEYLMQQKREQNAADVAVITDTVTAISKELAAAASVLRRHSQLIVEIDERLDRTERHLEVHSLLIDDLIRNKAERKKRG